MQRIHSFPAVLPKNPRVLILGSMPSVKSLEKQEYYGNPRNHFWPIMFELFQQKPLETYSEKIAFLKGKKIALWDVIQNCFRQGSLDANIIEEEPNDIFQLLDTFPSLKLIGCNGTKAYQTFQKHFKNLEKYDVEVIQLPSTSPIPGKYTKSFSEKVEAWSIILPYLMG
ncbi:DNA-deoxyinosine glycosylase [Ornithinibacillus sp. 4-3]|uniref:DNA-deoxyinosine glycosylase n=1 Tax=Ornithinibacillus sp. 4-3 TaxID=3231488 RepID=A0AB39HPD5_9BACI